MNDDLAETIRSSWGDKTMAAFRLEAKRSPDGAVFEALREDGGRRFVMILCATRKAEISSLVKALDLPVSTMTATVDWAGSTLLDLLMSTPEGASCACCVARAPDGRLEALLVLAHTPRSITMLERGLGLPP